ncbi:MAG: formylglycine-generating enzyme family protein [Bacteroidales bacterium]|nr:formylglycine-generating enzyme family protein [Bacteroidales bacterium]
MKSFFNELFVIVLMVFLIAKASGQELKFHDPPGLGISVIKDQDRDLLPYRNVPLFSFDLDGSTHYSNNAAIEIQGEKIYFTFPSGIRGYLQIDKEFKINWKATLLFENPGIDTLVLENVLPFGISDQHIYITGAGPWSLARTKLFRPAKIPLGVILPDNAWEMGYASIPTNADKSICAISRRTEIKGAKRQRYKTILYPHSSVAYTLYLDLFEGEWQNGLKKMFQEHYLFDLEEFDNTLFEREDLSWIRHDYLMILQFGWDHKFFDWKEDQYNFKYFLEEAKEITGGYDVYGIWPTWPALGMDQRNQWDLYADLPGGLKKLHELATLAQNNDTKFFIAYNPWDKSTRKENPHKGMARLIEATDANGVVLETRGKSSYELQNAADSIKEGVVMYSEGMAVTKDMPGIISGRVHDAIYMPPPLNLNKLIKPDFAIFRVCQLSQGRIHREASISFFNGYGNELNTFAAGRPDWMQEEYKYLGKITMLLRENSKAFNSLNWTPLIPTFYDSIWVNRWPSGNKTIYTVFSLKPEGFDDALFEADTNHHYVSLYHHEELGFDTIDGRFCIPAKTHAFDRSWLNTRREGNVDCIAAFRDLLSVERHYDTLFLAAEKGTEIRLWAGDPSYSKDSRIFTSGSHKVKLYELFGRYEGKFVVQLFDDTEIIDERIVYIKPGSPRLISTTKKTKITRRTPEGMVLVEGGTYEFQVDLEDAFIPYPDYSKARKAEVRSFFMDQYPVTNEEYYQFTRKSNYQPDDTVNYLKHWKNGKYPKGMENFPVVHVSLKDARAYAAWAGKRLPTEIEWQYAAQGGNSGQKWPWGNTFDSTRCNNAFGYITAVDSFPQGANQYGLIDMVGNVWQMTGDVYDNGSYYFNILKGGSYYKPTASWWYVQGGPKAVNENQMLLLVSPSFNRNATVGFRCVKDAIE